VALGSPTIQIPDRLSVILLQGAGKVNSIHLSSATTKLGNGVRCGRDIRSRRSTLALFVPESRNFPVKTDFVILSALVLFVRRMGMLRIMLMVLFALGYSHSACATDYGALVDSVDKDKAVESVDTKKLQESVSSGDVDYGKAIESVDKKQAADSIDTKKAAEALAK
jgi:hypothetical protein